MNTSRHGADCFDIISFAGGSEGGKVYHVRHKDTGEPLTMHVIQKHNESISQQLDSSLVVELFRIPYAVSLRYTFETKSRHYAVLDNVKEERQLGKFFQAYGPFELCDVTFIIAEILVSIGELHAYHTTYQWLGLNNIFLDITGHVRLKRELLEEAYWVQNECFRCRRVGHCRYHEQAAVGQEAFAKDWSDVAILLCMLLTGRKPSRREEVRNDSRICRSISLPTGLPKEAADLAKALLSWRKAPFTALQIRQHEFFSNIDWQKVQNRTLISPEIFVRTPPKVLLGSSPVCPTGPKGFMHDTRGVDASKSSVDEQFLNDNHRKAAAHGNSNEGRLQHHIDLSPRAYRQEQLVDWNNNEAGRRPVFYDSRVSENDYTALKEESDEIVSSCDNADAPCPGLQNRFDTRSGTYLEQESTATNGEEVPDNVTFVTAESLDRAFQEQRHSSKKKHSVGSEAQYSTKMAGSPLSDSLKADRYYQTVCSPTYQQQQSIPTYTSLYNSFTDSYSAAELRHLQNPVYYSPAQVRKRDDQPYAHDKQHTSSYHLEHSNRGKSEPAITFANPNSGEMSVRVTSPPTTATQKFIRSRSYNGNFADDRFDQSVPLSTSLNVVSPIERANELLKSTFGGDWRLKGPDDGRMRKYSETYLSQSSLEVDKDTGVISNGKNNRPEPLHKRLSRSLINLENHLKSDTFPSQNSSLMMNPRLRMHGEAPELSASYFEAPRYEDEDEHFMRDYLNRSLPMETKQETDDDILKRTWPVGPSLLKTSRSMSASADVGKRSSSLMQKISDHGALQLIREGAYLQRKRDFSLPLKQPLTSSISAEKTIRKTPNLSDVRGSKSFDDRYLLIDEELASASLQSFASDGSPKSVGCEERKSFVMKARGSDSSVESPVEVQQAWHDADRNKAHVANTDSNQSDTQSTPKAPSAHKRRSRGRSRKTHEKTSSPKTETDDKDRNGVGFDKECIKEEPVTASVTNGEVFLESKDYEAKLLSKGSFEEEKEHIKDARNGSSTRKHDVKKTSVQSGSGTSCGNRGSDEKLEEGDGIRRRNGAEVDVAKAGKPREDNDKMKRRKLRRTADVKKGKSNGQESNNTSQGVGAEEHSNRNPELKEETSKNRDELKGVRSVEEGACKGEILNDEVKDAKSKKKKSTRSVSFYDSTKNVDGTGKYLPPRKSKSTGSADLHRAGLSDTNLSKERDIEILPNPKSHRGGHRRLKSAEEQRQADGKEHVRPDNRKGSLDSNIGRIQNDAMGVNDLVDRLKVISETGRSSRTSPSVERRFNLNSNEELDRTNSVRNILKPRITVENSTPRSSSPVATNAEGDTGSRRNSSERNVSRECSIGSASDLWIDEEVINRRQRSRCRRSASAASGRSSESVEMFRAKYAMSPILTSTSSEDDTNMYRDPDKQSFISGRSIDSGLSDIFETSREEATDSVRPRTHAVAKSDSGVMKDINEGASNQPDDVFYKADPSQCSKEPESLCHHCQDDFQVESESTSELSFAICKKCNKKKVERKEAVVELIQTEINYGQDLRILKEEFYAPIKNGGILSPENVNGVFLNLQELIDVNSKLCITLQGDLEECITRNDQELESLEVGRVFLENVEFFQAYEVFCSKQGQAADLVANLQKKSELLRIFLQVSCKQNSKLRKMDLKSFLTMPVQRIMKYPLLLTRIYRATPRGNPDREALVHARRKIEEQITRINEIAAGRPAKLRKSKSTSALNQSESKGNQLTKLVADILDWRLEETQIVLSDAMEVSSCELINVENWSRKSLKKSCKVQAILCAYGVLEHSQALKGKSEDQGSLEPRGKCEATSAAVIILRRKSANRYSLHKVEGLKSERMNYIQYQQEPILLGKAVVSQRADVKTAFEILPIAKEPISFVADEPFCCQKWLKYLQFYSKDLGLWRARRNAMANIMIQSMS